MDNIAINQETSTKFLGVIINQSSSWNDHIAIVKQKVSKSIGIKHISRNLPQSVLLTLYFFHLYIHILNIVILCGVYAVVLCLIVYSCCKKAIRVITNSQWNYSYCFFVSQITYFAFVPAK